MATSYVNKTRKPLTIGDKTVKPGGSFTDDQAAQAGINVRALIKARAVTVKKPKPVAKKPVSKKAGS